GLHYTGKGMQYWYEAKDGFMAITKIPYAELGCKGCHCTGCNDCHIKKTEDGGYEYSVEVASERNTCLKCHAREKATYKYDESINKIGVHMKADMNCVDCHSKKEIHGDGGEYESMRGENAMNTACGNCHESESIPKTKSHTVHNEKLECNACHVQNSMTCYNCHFGELAKTKSKPKSFVKKVKDFLILVKYKGKITSGTMQTLVGNNDEPFIVYVPYFTHSVMKNGRKCEQCHATEAVNVLASNKEFVPATFKDGESKFYNGILPLVPDLLNWPFLRKQDGQWVTYKPKEKPLIQLGLYAEPFTQDELNKLKIKQKYEN
ncbi:MAG: hypothetical protein KAR38_09965, partial [Calditrichia bacterium]|nr:hypothetical protein [Calditrichia bacterium]